MAIDITYGDEHVPGSRFVVPVQQQSAARSAPLMIQTLSSLVLLISLNPRRRTRAYGPGLERGRVADDSIFHVQVPFG